MGDPRYIGMPIKGISLKIAFDKLRIKRLKKYTVMTWYKNNDLLDLKQKNIAHGQSSRSKHFLRVLNKSYHV